MASTDSVPARIVIIGTSKMRLSERFNKLQKAPSSEPTRTVQQMVRKNCISSKMSASSVPVIARPTMHANGLDYPRDFGRDQPSIGTTTKSFLHDDYMDNALYGIGMEQVIQRPFLSRMRGNSDAGSHSHNSAQPIYEKAIGETDPLKLTLDDYDHYSRVRPYRSIHSRLMNLGRPRFRNLPIYNKFDEHNYEKDAFHQRNFYNNEHSYRPIQQRLSFLKPKSSGLSDFDFLRRPIHRSTVQFKRPIYRGVRFNNRPWFGGRRRVNYGSTIRRRGGQRWNDKRLKKTVQEMDKELDEYMRSTKHPRVQPAEEKN